MATILVGSGITTGVNTVRSLIDETRRHLYSGERDELNILTNDPGSSTITLDNALGNIRVGAILSIDIELMLVTSVSGQNATVVRGYLGSSAVGHAAGSLVWVNPKFSDFAIFRELQHEFTALSSPQNGLFRIASDTLTKNANGQYPFTFPSGFLDVYDMRVTGSKPYEGRKVKFHDHDGSVFRISDSPPPSEIVLRYRQAFSIPTAVEDDVETITGLHPEAHDIPPMGAALRLVHPREVKRGGTEAQTDARRAEEVPPGTTLGAARFLAAIREQRIAQEVARLNARFPPQGF